MNPTTSRLPLNSNNNKLINEAGSLCCSDSVEEENEVEEQSGRPIQREIPQSQRGKAKTVLFENKLTTASFADRFFIHAVTVARQISDWKIKLHNSRNKSKAGKRVWKRSCFAFGRVGEKYMIICDTTHVDACTKLDTYLCSLLRGPYNLSACRQRNDIGLQYGLEGLRPRKSGLSMLYTCPNTLQFLSKSES